MADQVSAPGSVKLPEPLNRLPSSTVASAPADTVGATLATVIDLLPAPGCVPSPSVRPTVIVYGSDAVAVGSSSAYVCVLTPPLP